MTNNERLAAAADFKSKMEALNQKYQAAIPGIRKWAYSLTSADLNKHLSQNGVSHVSDLVHIMARKIAIA